MLSKLNITSSRKIGQPNYGSRGAIVGIELEIGPEVLDDPRQLHDKIARLFRLARSSVDHELLARDQVDPDRDHAYGTPLDPIRSATHRQIRALRAIANRREIDLRAELQKRSGVTRPEDLSVDKASELISALSANNCHFAVGNEMAEGSPKPAD